LLHVIQFACHIFLERSKKIFSDIFNSTQLYGLGGIGGGGGVGFNGGLAGVVFDFGWAGALIA
jgi:hypothetical protein